MSTKYFDSQPIYISSTKGSGKGYLIQNILTSQNDIYKKPKIKTADITNINNIIIVYPEENDTPFYSCFITKHRIFNKINPNNIRSKIENFKNKNWVVVFDNAFTTLFFNEKVYEINKKEFLLIRDLIAINFTINCYYRNIRP